MAKNDQEDALDKVLTASLGRAVDFVKFAETKNAALLAFCSAWIIGLINLLVSQNQLPLGYRTVFLFSLPLFVFAAVTCIASFFPRIRLEKFHMPRDGAKNLLFFGHLEMIPLDEIRSALVSRYLPEKDHSYTQSYLEDISIQIGVNSGIAARKFRMFNIAAGLALFAIAAMALPPLGWLVSAICSAVLHK